MNVEKLEEVNSFKNFGPTLTNNNYHGDRSNKQTEQVVDKQVHPVPHQVQALQVLRSRHPSLRLRDMDAS
ncbi:hypothetical protein DPMN_164894 [Dreissena polymorpha]|uniref:Uncharacterized protein n=1 Tax=Dreissena polymorpha TaxID=45954 RepID=A0A9D4EZB8_DREPO|nr:hypothetical protein DPMN_164889 [Dreissena polymorpha]KAH3786784.1 hypothetical protein DPMN_164894 [Dreissena polymorpha]